MNKKGEITDIIMFVIIIFFIAVSFIATGFVNTKIRDVITTTPLNNTDVAPNAVAGIDNITNNALGNVFIMFLAFSIIGIMVSSFMVRYHPMWIFIFIIFGLMSIFIAILLANAYNTFTAADGISAFASGQPTINWVMQHLVMITLGTFGIGLIVLFTRLPNIGFSTGGGI